DGDDRRFPQAFTIYEDALLPAAYAGRVIAPNSLHNIVWTSRLERDGSTWRTVDEAPLVDTDDNWFRPVYAGVGPDGAVYMADWYDSRLSHVSPVDDWHKASGRIYRVVPEGESPRYEAGDLAKRPSADLVGLLAHASRLVRRRAVLELGWRGDTSVRDALAARVDGGAMPQALEGLWALHLLDQLDDDASCRWLDHPNADVRRWVVRLAGDSGEASPALAAALAARARDERDVQVRVQLAASARRLPVDVALPIVNALVGHDEDVADPHQPLMLWWALERHVDGGLQHVERWLDAADWKRPLL